MDRSDGSPESSVIQGLPKRRNIEVVETSVTAVGQRVGYVRVSTADQNPDRQLEAIGECARVFTDHASGSSKDRPALADLISHVRQGDEVVVTSMDRLARSLADLQQLVDQLTRGGVTVTFVAEGLTFGDERKPLADLMLGLLGAVAQFERALIRERQQAGIEAAKARGVYKGRKTALTSAQQDELRDKASEPGANRSQLAEEYGISRATLYKYLKASAT